MTKTYIIDADNCLSIETEAPATIGSGASFTSQEELADATKDWPASRLVEVWNSFAGAPPFGDLKEIRRFTDRKSAIARIWGRMPRVTASVPMAMVKALSILIASTLRSFK